MPCHTILTSITKSPLAYAVSHHGQSNVPKPVEDNDDGEPDLPRVDVVLVEVAVVPTDGEVVGRSHDPCCSNGVVGADVGYDGNLGGESNIGEQELPEQGSEWTSPQPDSKRVEQKLVASIGIFLPSGQLVVDGERDTFFETLASPGGKTDNITLTLKAK